jgi:hypothetical protein
MGGNMADISGLKAGIKRGLCVAAFGAVLVALGGVPALRAQQADAPSGPSDMRACLQGAQARVQESIGLLSRPVPSVSGALPKLYDATSTLADCMARFAPPPPAAPAQ